MSTRGNNWQSSRPDEQVQAEILADALSAVGDEQITVIEKGRRRKISKREANITQVVNAALKGDRQATKTLLRYVKQMKSASEAKQKTIFVDEYGTPYPR